MDNAVDIVYWEDTDFMPAQQWVYVAGYHTTPNGATVFATSRYPAQYTGPGENDPVTVYYPPDPATATGGNRAVAIDIDAEGNVYVTGESSDPTGANGQDIVIIKYDKNLDPDEDWVRAGHQGAVVRWDNPFVTGPLNHDRAVDLSLATGYEPDPKNPNVVGVTGTTFVGTQTGRNDIVTLHFDANTGDLVNTFGTGGAVIKVGTGNTDDIPVGIKMYW